MAISAEEREIIREILDLHERRTTHTLPEVMDNPVANYTDPARLEREVEVLFREFPIVLAHVSELAEPGDFETVRDAMREAGHEPENAELTMRADNSTVLELQNASSMVKMLEMLEDLDDVQNVYSNADIPDDVLAQL